jgi:hypothetical protein
MVCPPSPSRDIPEHWPRRHCTERVAATAGTESRFSALLFGFGVSPRRVRAAQSRGRLNDSDQLVPTVIRKARIC